MMMQMGRHIGPKTLVAVVVMEEERWWWWWWCTGQKPAGYAFAPPPPRPSKRNPEKADLDYVGLGVGGMVTLSPAQVLRTPRQYARSPQQCGSVTVASKSSNAAAPPPAP